jgi:DNA modification methylase
VSVRIITGDALTELNRLPEGSVHCCVTSPPYYGLRDYGVDGQLGLEATPDAYVAAMVGVFREVRRVLRSDGTLWLNIGDSYANDGKWGGKTSGKHVPALAGDTGIGRRRQNTGLKSKDLIGIPWALAKALRDPYYTGTISREVDRVWLAAIIDGEGCFFIHKRKAGTSAYSSFVRADGTEAHYSRTADTYEVGLEISNTSKALIDRVAEIVPGGTFTTQGPEQNARRRQTIYRWRLAPNETKRLAQELYPHLVAKQHQARLIFSCPSSGDAGAAAHEAMMALHNGAGTSVNFPAPPSLFEPGWYLRQDIIWGKPNPMPESVTDRCTKAHEYLFLLSKSKRYYFDAGAVKENRSHDEDANTFRGGCYVSGDTDNGTLGKRRIPGNKRHKHQAAYEQGDHRSRTKAGLLAYCDRERAADQNDLGSRNKRSVWTIATAPFPEAHFATFPPALVEPCIKAGCPAGGTVLDPFLGAGTTALVADRLGRSAIGIELNLAYAEMARQRIADDAGLFFQAAK